MSGYEPIQEDMTLSRAADWTHRYEKAKTDPVFPAGTTARVEITRDDKMTSPVLETWDAESVTGTYIEFWVQSNDTDQIPARYHYRLMVRYPPAAPITDTYDFCWYRGNVKRKD
ncbi:hypothetical protein ACFULT_26250 [Rhodococcus sp. NPDC057297]|uniref:LtfC-like domain-containing protein n=1 Tax=Rhodococcus sp. NPDC057297 TaxID=3346090 RepID=UPI00362EDECD